MVLQFESQLLSYQYSSVLVLLGKQQKVLRAFGLLLPAEEPGRVQPLAAVTWESEPLDFFLHHCIFQINKVNL